MSQRSVSTRCGAAGAGTGDNKLIPKQLILRSSRLQSVSVLTTQRITVLWHKMVSLDALSIIRDIQAKTILTNN